MKPGDSRDLILTGFMGTGKTSVGRALAGRLGREFVDMDTLIESREGASISEVFRQHGEPYFRRLEAALCRELAARETLDPASGGRVIATGGGTLLNDDSRDILAATGPIVCLCATPEEIQRRLESHEDRPLLSGSDRRAHLSHLLDERAAAYRRFSYQVDTTGLTVGQVADRIVALSREPFRRSLSVRHPGGEYAIHLGDQLLAECGAYVQATHRWHHLALVTNPTVGDIYRSSVVRSLEQAGIRATTCVVPDGERYKTLDTVRSLYGSFLEAGLDRHCAVLALGGGVIGDMAGFAASTYLRGVPFLQLPTTLLAMVDSSTGGKVAVDLPQGKNLVGAFKQPALVLADLSTLHTLPPSQVRSGLGEVVKTGLLGDPLLFQQIEDHGPSPILWIIERSLRVKARVVEADPYEHGQRAILNLGHTFAHALELLSGYALSHGAAVSIGLVAAARLSARLGHCDPGLATRAEATLASLGLPVSYAGHRPEQIWRAMATDKKVKGGKLRFILIRAVGESFISDTVPKRDVLAVLDSMNEDQHPASG